MVTLSPVDMSLVGIWAKFGLSLTNINNISPWLQYLCACVFLSVLLSDINALKTNSPTAGILFMTRKGAAYSGNATIIGTFKVKVMKFYI